MDKSSKIFVDRCIHTCEPRITKNVETTGWRGTFFFPGGGTYKGAWQKNKPQFYGGKVTKRRLIYEGQWQQGKRHGNGYMRRRNMDNTEERIYNGTWEEDKKAGYGEQFDLDGYYMGWWRDNRRCGLGLKLYSNSTIYMGEWDANVWHGLGVHVQVNGNRYEGHFARGFKNGEGTFYHMHTGQIQKGMWEDDVCKTSLVMDEFRNQVKRPTPYPIPKLKLEHPDSFIARIFEKYIPNKDKPNKSFDELNCLKIIEKMKTFSGVEARGFTYSKVPFPDVEKPHVCHKIEQNVMLKQLDVNLLPFTYKFL